MYYPGYLGYFYRNGNYLFLLSTWVVDDDENMLLLFLNEVELNYK